MVTRLDRLARSTRDLLNTLATIVTRAAGFRSLGDVWADTTTPHGRLLLTVLGGLAEFERELILARTGEGRAGQGTGEGAGREDGPQAEADTPSTQRGPSAHRGRRGDAGHRSVIQRRPHNDLAARTALIIVNK
mgnify:CR=1 FL=1